MYRCPSEDTFLYSWGKTPAWPTVSGVYSYGIFLGKFLPDMKYSVFCTLFKRTFVVLLSVGIDEILC